MQINGGVFNLAMTEEHLDGAQVGTRFEQVSCKTVPEVMLRVALNLASSRG